MAVVGQMAGVPTAASMTVPRAQAGQVSDRAGRYDDDAVMDMAVTSKDVLTNEGRPGPDGFGLIGPRRCTVSIARWCATWPMG